MVKVARVMEMDTSLWGGKPIRDTGLRLLREVFFSASAVAGQGLEDPGPLGLADTL